MGPCRHTPWSTSRLRISDRSAKPCAPGPRKCSHETVAQTVDADEPMDAVVQESFERICTGSTIAVARWIAGDPIEVTLEAGRETSQIFGELAAHRAASLQRGDPALLLAGAT